jgi:hypothetical protein
MTFFSVGTGWRCPRKDLRDVGRYRRSSEPMQIVSRAVYAPKVHFEAPSSTQVATEMARSWNGSMAQRRERPENFRL